MVFSTFVPGIMAAPTGAPSPVSPHQDPAVAKRRNRLLCQRCRHDKQGCHPQNRNWDDGEKCDRCEERGYECSKPEKAPFKQRRRRATMGVATTQPQSASSNAQHLCSVHTATMHPLTASVSAPTPGPRPILAWDSADVESFSSDNTVPSSAQPELESTTISTRKSNELEALTILAKLGDLNATRELLRADLVLCDQAESWLGCSASIRKTRDAIKAAISAVTHDFKTSLELAMPFVTKSKDIGSSKKAFVAQVQFVQYRFFNPPVPATDEPPMFMEPLDDVDLNERLQELNKRKKIWSAADYLFGNVCGRSSSRHAVHTHSEHDIALCYTKASESIRDVFSEIVLEDFDHRRIICTTFGRTKNSISALPPCHLAISQASPSVLLTLWKSSAMHPWDKDYLRRTPVHSAAYAGKIQGLRSIFQTNPSAATNNGWDSFGMTPLAIAACKDDVKAFITLERAGAVVEGTSPDITDNMGTKISVFGLAARNGSVNVVKHIASHAIPALFQVGGSELCEALTNNQEHIAHILIDWHCKRINHSLSKDGYPESAYDLSDQVIPALRLAEEKNLLDVSSRLKELMPNCQSGISSMEEIMFEQYTNPSALWVDQDPYNLSQSTTSHESGFDNVMWDFQEPSIPSFTPLYMQGPVVPTPMPGNGSFMAAPNHDVLSQRHRGPPRARPP